MLIATIRDVIKVFRERRAALRDKQERAAIAKAFNDRYTYRKELIPGMDYIPGAGSFGLRARAGYAWMCPECNCIHHPTECSVWVGLLYPKCCSRGDGHRLDDGIKTR